MSRKTRRPQEALLSFSNLLIGKANYYGE